MTKNNNNSIIIALDIDDFLASMEIKDLHKKEWLDLVHYRRDNFINVEFNYNDNYYQVEHLLTPGCIEFLRFLFEHEYIRVAFFSSGVHARNIDFAKKVVQTSINVGGDSTWMNRYDVYSREDCFNAERLNHYMSRDICNKFQPEKFFGNYKKDMRVICFGREEYQELYRRTLENPSVLLPDYEKNENLLKNMVLVEEDPSYLFPGQEKNMLLCPTFRHPYHNMVNYCGDDTPYNPKDWRDDFKSINTIFYATGVLKHIFERHFSDGTPIPEILWQEQGYLWGDSTNSEERYPIHFFTKGRDTLRKYNPELNFAVTDVVQ